MALIEKLEAIGDAIRAKTGGTEQLTLDDMVDEIEGIETGGGGSSAILEPLTMTSLQTYTPGEGVDGFSNVTPSLDLVINNYDWKDAFVTLCKGAIPLTSINTFTLTTNNATYASHVFETATTAAVANPTSLDNFFANKVILDFNNKPLATIPIFYNYWGTTADVKEIKNYQNSTSNQQYVLRHIFYNAYFLENISDKVKNFYITMINKFSNIVSDFQNVFINCYNLSEDNDDLRNAFVNANFVKMTYSTNFAMNNTYYRNCEIEPFYFSTVPSTAQTPLKGFSYAGLKHLTFKPFDTTRSDYQYPPITLDFTQIGYSATTAASYLKSSERITDNNTYTALKNNPKAWTTIVNYSFYNKVSALETINSLPDMTKKKNTNSYTYSLKFKGAAGTDTDGGAIKTLTSAEKAIATNKGWTIALS